MLQCRRCLCDRADGAGAFDPGLPRHISIYQAQRNNKSFCRGKPQLWLMLCMVCKSRSIRKGKNLAEPILWYNNSMLTFVRMDKLKNICCWDTESFIHHQIRWGCCVCTVLQSATLTQTVLAPSQCYCLLVEKRLQETHYQHTGDYYNKDEQQLWPAQSVSSSPTTTWGWTHSFFPPNTFITTLVLRKA